MITTIRTAGCHNLTRCREIDRYKQPYLDTAVSISISPAEIPTGNGIEATLLPGADDRLRERVTVEIARLRVQRVLQDALHTTGQAQDLRARCGHFRAVAGRGSLVGAGSEHHAG